MVVIEQKGDKRNSHNNDKENVCEGQIILGAISSMGQSALICCLRNLKILKHNF